MSALFKFSEVEASNASPATLREIIKGVLRAKDDACATEMERYMMPPGVAGSREYDHAYAVDVLLRHDRGQDKLLHVYMVEHPSFTRRLLWDQIVVVYRSVGYRIRHGRVIGLIEHKDKESDPEENGRPDGIE